MSSTDLPLDALGPVLAEFSSQVAEETSTPVEMAAMLGLGVLSTAALGKAVVQLKHSWVEHLGVWSVTIAESGERKTAVLRHVAKPLRKHQARMRDEGAEDLVRRQRAYRSHIKRAEKLENAVAQAPAGPELIAAEIELEKWSEQIAGETEPGEYLLLVDDITPEALATALEANPRLGFISDEAGPLEALAHAPSDRLSRLDIYLKAYDGEPHTVHRVERKPEYVREPLISFAVCVQPVVARAVLADSRLERRGALSRFLWCRPRSMVGYRHDPDRRVLTDATVEAWDRLVRRLLELPQPENAETRPVMTFDPSGALMLEAYGDEVEEQLRPGARLSEIASWGGKERGRVGRLAGLLHLADGNEPATPIHLSTVERAIEIGRWSTVEALKLFGDAQSVTVASEAEEKVTRTLLAHARENGPDSPLRASDVYRNVKGGSVPDRETLDFVLGELEVAGLIDVQELPSGPRGGRPGHSIALLPRLLSRLENGQ